LAAIVDRLRGVIIENKDAVAVMADHDGPRTLHYIDPPYVWDTRAPGNPYHQAYGGYTHDMNDDQHRALLAAIMDLDGMVAISGYRHPIYDAALASWQRFDVAAHADGARARTESLWLNRAAVQAREQLSMTLV
jgi:DNA adenine methylase